jgi:hypothetical protein
MVKGEYGKWASSPGKRHRSFPQGEFPMQNDKQVLEQFNIHLKELEELNIRIGLAETKGDRNWLDSRD